MTEYILRGNEAPVDLDLVDLTEPIGADGDNCHVAQIVGAYINGVRIPLVQEQVRLTLGSDEATVAYLPVFVRSLQTIQATACKRETND